MKEGFKNFGEEVKEGFENFGEEVKDTFDCRKKGESCVGVIHCCGTLQCYFENGAGKDIVSKIIYIQMCTKFLYCVLLLHLMSIKQSKL